MYGNQWRRHNGSHKPFTDAQREILKAIADKMRNAIDVAAARGDVDGVYNAVRQAERRVERMREISEASSVNTNASYTIPLNYKDAVPTGSGRSLERQWRDRLLPASTMP